MTVCAVKGCHNSSHNNQNHLAISFHLFPSNPTIAARWIQQIRLNRKESYWKPTKHTKICSAHFDDEEKYITKGGNRKLREGAIPTKALDICCTDDTQISGDPDPLELDVLQMVQDHDYHQPTSSSQQARIPPPSTGPTEQCDQLPESKEIIFNVYYFLQDEYKSLKQFTGETCDLSPLAHILGRTAEATGVSEETVCRILKERKRPSHVKGDRGETKRVRLSENESVSSPIEQDTRSSISTDSDPNADDIAETNEDENETGTLKLKFEVDEEYSEAGRKRLVMTFDPSTVQSTSTGHQISSPEFIEMEKECDIKMDPDDMEYVQPTSTGHRIPSPEYIQMEKECEIKMDPDEMVHIQSTSSVHHELSPTHPEVKLEPCDTRSQQSTSFVHVELSPTQPEVKLEPCDTQSQHEDQSLTLDIKPVFSEGVGYRYEENNFSYTQK